MAKYRKKPVVIEAFQWTNQIGQFRELNIWSNGAITSASPILWAEKYSPFDLEIHTREGVMLCKLNDWVIKGIEGEFYPCEPDIFVKTYEPVV